MSARATLHGGPLDGAEIEISATHELEARLPHRGRFARYLRDLDSDPPRYHFAGLAERPMEALEAEINAAMVLALDPEIRTAIDALLNRPAPVRPEKILRELERMTHGGSKGPTPLVFDACRRYLEHRTGRTL